ncbi:MAG TPA: lamin tail domain-containing protein [Candidatus Saccharimonadales bacterium]
MKRQTIAATVYSILCAFLLALAPLPAIAEELPLPETELPIVASLPPVIITEVQTGLPNSGYANMEFIELYNTTDAPLDISGWQIRYSSAVASGSGELITIAAAVSGQVMLDAKSHYVVKQSAATAISADQTYAATLSKTGKTLALFAPNQETCELEVVDAVAWSAPDKVGESKGEGRPLIADDSKDNLLQRYTSEGTYVDTDDNLHDFTVSLASTSAPALHLADGATPGTLNANSLPAPAEDAPEPLPGNPSLLPPVSIAGCTVPDPPAPEDPPVDPPTESPPSTTLPPDDTEPDDDEDQAPRIPAGNIGLKAPIVSELLPNPASPQTDANDEFIELYNLNDKPFDLSGYALEVGLTTKRRYTFPRDTIIQPHSFRAFFSADTGLALSNTSGKARLIDPLGTAIAEGQQYESAKDGQAWLLANGLWQWTMTPTPNAINVVSAPVVAKKKASAVKNTSVTKTASAAKISAEAGTDQDVQKAAAVAATARTPLHPWALALVATSALLYGAYEYRHDMANKLYQLRSNRAARREIRRGPKGR